MTSDGHRTTSRPLLAFVGGFLGAGKTTLILKAAEVLRQKGYRPAMIFNDQDAGLVDTRRALAEEWTASEVSGGCFCCRFSELMEATDELLSYQPDIILAEPVGSCIDLSATILHPLHAMHGSRYRLAPLTVLIDPDLATRVSRQEVPEAVTYLFKEQVAEADLICVTKMDLHVANPILDFPVDLRLSAKTGEGVNAWLEEIVSGARVPGARLLAIDYQEYGLAEAELGWVNVHAKVHLTEPLSPLVLGGPALDRIADSLASAGLEIAHLKIFDRCPSGWISASICSSRPTPVPIGDLLADPAKVHELAINLRAVADPLRLREIVEASLSDIPGRITVTYFSAFRPQPPTPEYRYLQGYVRQRQ